MVDLTDELRFQELHNIWDDARTFNNLVKALKPEIKNWKELYVLGVLEELGELLREAKWKKHRLNVGAEERFNVMIELADITKYVISLWQEYGFNLDEMLVATLYKSKVVHQRLQSEFFPLAGQNVILTDLDGTIADFRKGFADWAKSKDEVQSLSFDLDNDISFTDYRRIKHDFEANGGYGILPPYLDGVDLLRAEILQGTRVIVATARPSKELLTVEKDTRTWLEQHGIAFAHLIFGRDERLETLLSLTDSNRVLFLEDDPITAERAANLGFKVWMRRQPYNANLCHANITTFDTFPMVVKWEEL